MPPRSLRKRRASRLALVAVCVLVVLGLWFHSFLFALVADTVVRLRELTPSSPTSSRIDDLERELARVRYQAVLYKTLVEEYNELAHHFELNTDETVAVGVVVVRPPRTHYDTLLLALPEGHGVAAGDYAVFEQVQLGTISQVSARAAVVTLFSSGGTSVDARVGEPSGIVVLTGMGGGAFTFDVPTNVAVSPGDVLVTPDGSGRALATVARVVTKSDSTISVVYAHLPVAFPDIRYVSVVRAESPEL